MGRRGLAFAVLLAACTAHKKLTPLADIPHLKELAGSAAALPNERGHVTVDGIKLGHRRPAWPAIERLVTEYKNITAKTLVIWGARDETFPSSMGYKLATQIPDAWLHVAPRRMHQLPGEAPVECANLIREFTAEGGRGRPRYVD